MKDLLTKLFCLAAVALASSPSPATARQVRLTDDAGATGCGSFRPASDANGKLVVFESDCDLADAGDGGASNPDGNREIFRLRRPTPINSLEQLTDSAGCSNMAPTVSQSGRYLAFESDCDLVPPGNSDASIEIFWMDANTSEIRQLTNRFDCASVAPKISSNGRVVTFDSDCNHTGENFDFFVDIFQATDTGVIAQISLDESGECDSVNPSSSSSGDVVAFESDCNLTGINEDFAVEIFRSEVGGAVEQLTTLSDDTCGSSMPTASIDGSTVAFQSDCDLTGGNPDNSEEIFLIDAGGNLHQLTDDDGDPVCESILPAVSADGNLVTYTSYCDPLGLNGDASEEVFRVSVGGRHEQLTDGAECSSVAVSTSRDGVYAFYEADCDPVGTNADGSVELFSIGNCICGDPLAPGKTAGPAASDALAVLRAAVDGGLDCEPCFCDVNWDENDPNIISVTATDALHLLRAAVGGISVDELTCPPL